MNLTVKTYKEQQDRIQHLLDDLETTRQEKNEEIKSLKVQIAEALVHKTSSDTWQSRCQYMEYELESLKLSAEQKEIEQEGMLQKYRTELQIKTQTMTEAQDKVGKLSQENDKLQLELAHAKLTADDLQEDVERLRVLAAKDHSDKEELMTQIEMLQGENTRTKKELNDVKERLKTVEDEHAQLVGHQNHKQKIHFHQAVKDENNLLREQVVKLTSELAKFKSGRSGGIDSVLKENIHPMKRTPAKCTVPVGKSSITPGRTNGHTGRTHTTPGNKSRSTQKTKLNSSH